MSERNREEPRVLPIRGYLLHITHYDPEWVAHKEEEEPFNVELGLELIDAMAEVGLNLLLLDPKDGVRYASHPELSRHYSQEIHVLRALSDRVGDRWRMAAAGLVPGMAGFGLLSAGLPFTTLVGVPLTAITGGSNQGLSTVLIGDLGNVGRQSRRLGVLFTIGDLMSAIGPPLAYGLMPLFGIGGLYLLVAGLFVIMFMIILGMDRQRRALRRAQVNA